MFRVKHTLTSKHLQRMRAAVVIWLALGMLAAFASPLLRPVRYEVVCGTHGKAQLIVHEDDNFGKGKSRPASPHAMDCALCVVNSCAPPPEHPAMPQAIVHLIVTRSPAPVHAVAIMATPPPARAPPQAFPLFFKQSSERSI